MRTRPRDENPAGGRTATHRPARRQRRFRWDDLIAVDLFSGFGGLTEGIRRAGFTTIMAANHNAYKVEVHEANHPYAEHWIADLVDPTKADYHSVRDLPAADLLVAGVSCVNHSQSNTERAYASGASLFDMDDPDYESRVTRSERDRATANCVLHYAAQHRPRMILVECTTELASWGALVPGKRKVGDGSTYRWWLKQFEKLGYRHRVLYLNSMFFGVGQSRDRGYWVFWLKGGPTPDLEHRPETWCAHCDRVVPAVWTWKTGIPATGVVRWGKQYVYRCPSCTREIVPPFTPSLDALDLSDLGTRIGDRRRPLAETTLARAERCRLKFPEFPAVLMPAKASRGTEKHLQQPMATQTSQQETAILSTGAPAVTATASPGEATGTGELIATGVIPYRKNTSPATHAEAMPTVTSDQIPGLLTARFTPDGTDRSAPATGQRPAQERAGTTDDRGTLFAGWYKENGSTGDATAAHPVTDPLGTLTARDTTAVLTAEWCQSLSEIALEDCYFRMMFAHEIGRGSGFDVPFPSISHEGTFIVWGKARQQVDGFGNAVSPPVGTWIGGRLRDALHGSAA